MNHIYIIQRPVGYFVKLVAGMVCIFGIMHTSKAQNQVTALPDDPLATETDRQFIKRAYEIARNAVIHGNHPFGALLVHEGKIVAEFENKVVTTGDVTLHAETGLVSDASKKIPHEILSQCTLYTSTQPCIMCCGAIYWAQITKIVYGTSEEQMDMLNSESKGHRISIEEVFKNIRPETTIIGPVLEEEGLAIHASYWNKKRD